MQFVQVQAVPSEPQPDALIIFIGENEAIANIVLAQLPTADAQAVRQVAESARMLGFTGKTGQTLLIPTYSKLPGLHLLLAALGKRSAQDAHAMRKASALAARKLNAIKGIESVAIALKDGQSETHLQAIVEGFILGAYQFTKYKKVEEAAKLASALVQVSTVVSPSAFAHSIERAQAIAEATIWARQMVAEPASYMTPTRLAEHASELESSGVRCQVVDSADAEIWGLSAFLAVARGAAEPPKFIILRYEGQKPAKTIGLAGKGITFDSGGLSLKTAQAMEHMKYDMSGAAAVLGTMQAMSKLKPNVNLVAVAAACENMPSGKALHPGDVIKALNGKTIEVNNTDAEGRLVLADALSYLCTQKVDEIIDIATLTGGVVTALGRAAAGIMGTDQRLVDGLIKSGEAAGEKFWQLPLFDEYKEALQSDIADLKNAGARGEAASAAAAMFLKEFVDDKSWAHLDIAGPAWMEKEKDDLNKGGTAFGVRTLCYYILSQSAQIN
jgi:leucyl aminopeptidase